MGPENKDSRSWDGQMGCWTWLSCIMCMNALPLSRLAQIQQQWHSSFFIWVMDGQSWPVSGQKRKGILLGFQIHTLMIFSMVENFYIGFMKEAYLQTAVLSSFEWVVHLNRFSFWYESFIRYFLIHVLFPLWVFSLESCRYLELTLGEHKQLLLHALMYRMFVLES